MIEGCETAELGNEKNALEYRFFQICTRVCRVIRGKGSQVHVLKNPLFQISYDVINRSLKNFEFLLHWNLENF